MTLVMLLNCTPLNAERSGEMLLSWIDDNWIKLRNDDVTPMLLCWIGHDFFDVSCVSTRADLLRFAMTQCTAAWSHEPRQTPPTSRSRSVVLQMFAVARPTPAQLDPAAPSAAALSVPRPSTGIQ